MILPASRCALLQRVHDIRDRGENLFSRIGLVGLRIDAQQVFGSRRAHHHPADIAQINFDAVEIFAAVDGPIEKSLQFRAAEMFDGLFFLARSSDVQIDAAVVVFAEFCVKHRDQLAETSCRARPSPRPAAAPSRSRRARADKAWCRCRRSPRRRAGCRVPASVRRCI